MGHLIAASSIASVHFCPCHVKSSGIALSRSTCAPVLRSSPPSVVWTARWGRILAGPSLHSWLCIPLWSIIASHVVPPLVLSLHLMFCGMLMHPILACVAALQCAFGRRVPSGGALHVPPVPGPPASGLLSFSSSSLRAHLSAASICAMFRMILERVRCAGPCVCSAGLFASSSSFMIHCACFMVRFASSLSSILPLMSTFTPACRRLALAVSASSLSGSCSSGLPIASACSCGLSSADP